MDSVRRFAGFLMVIFAIVTVPRAIAAYESLGLGEAVWVFAVGWLFLTPAAGVLAGYVPNPIDVIDRKLRQDEQPTSESDTSSKDHEQPTDPVETLRRRYAEGDIDEQKFEQRIETLLETEQSKPDDTEWIASELDSVAGTSRSGASQHELEPAKEER